MKIHPDWSSNGSVAITFDDDGEDATETYSDFSRLLKHFKVDFTTFRLRGSKTASMVVPVHVAENTHFEEQNTTSTNEESVEREDTTENNEHSEVNSEIVVKKKKKKLSSS